MRGNQFMETDSRECVPDRCRQHFIPNMKNSQTKYANTDRDPFQDQDVYCKKSNS